MSIADLFRYRPAVSPDAVTYADRKRSMLLMTIAWCFGTIYSDGIASTPLVGMFLMLGATPAWIGVLVALGSLASIAQPLGSYLVARTRSRKRLFFRLSYPGRAAWIAIAVLAAVLPPGLATIMLLFVIVLSARLAVSLAHPSWFSWMSDLAPKEELGAFWSTRQMAGRISGIIGLVILNFYLGKEPPFSKFVVFFIAVSLLGLVDIFLHRGVTGVHVTVGREPPGLRKAFVEPWLDEDYRRLLTFCLFFSFANQIGSGMMQLMLLKEIKLSYFEISLYMPGLTGAIWVLSSRWWGKIVDNVHEGGRLVFYLCAAMTAFHILIWPMIGARQHALIALVTVLSGMSWSGYHIGLTALIIGRSPRGARATYVAAYAVVFGIGNMVGSVIAGQLAERLADVAIFWGPFKLTQFRSLYLLSGIIRVLCLALLVRVRWPDSRPIGAYVRRLLSMNPFDRATWAYVRVKLGSPAREVEEA